MSAIVLIGGGGHAKVVAAILARQPERFAPIGYTDSRDRGPLLGLRHLGDDTSLETLLVRYPGLAAAIGVGFVRTATLRRRLYERLRALHLTLPAVVSPSALVADGVEVGEAAQVLDGVVVNPGATIGTGAILNTSCVVEHDVRIGDFTHVAPGAVVAGGATLGEDVLIGANATVIQGVSIADACIIGAGAVVTHSLAHSGTYVGMPARRVHGPAWANTTGE